MENKEYKRKYRELDDTTKKKISQSLRGRSKSLTHAEHISQGLKDYWTNVPSRENNKVEPDKSDAGM